MNDNTQAMTERTADSYVETLDEIWTAVDEGVEYEGQDALEYLDEMPLEIVYAMGRPFTVVLGTGGPHVEITADALYGEAQDSTLHVYWAGERAMRHHGGAIRRTAQHFLDISADI